MKLHILSDLHLGFCGFDAPDEATLSGRGNARRAKTWHGEELHKPVLRSGNQRSTAAAGKEPLPSWSGDRRHPRAVLAGADP